MLIAEKNRLNQQKEKFVIRNISTKEHKTTKQRLIEFYSDNFEQNAIPQQEINWGKPVRNEILSYFMLSGKDIGY